MKNHLNLGWFYTTQQWKEALLGITLKVEVKQEKWTGVINCDSDIRIHLWQVDTKIFFCISFLRYQTISLEALSHMTNTTIESHQKKL